MPRLAPDVIKTNTSLIISAETGAQKAGSQSCGAISGCDHQFGRHADSTRIVRSQPIHSKMVNPFTQTRRGEVQTNRAYKPVLLVERGQDLSIRIEGIVNHFALVVCIFRVEPHFTYCEGVTKSP